MAEIELNDLHKYGLIRDVKAYQIEPEAWTSALNIRFDKQGVEALTGRTQIFGTPLFAPHFAVPYAIQAQTYWVYASLAEIGLFDGASHTEITRQSGDYNTVYTREWQSTLFGGVLVFNNGIDMPQYWGGPGNYFADMPNFTSTLRAKVIRAFGPYLIALNLIDTGFSYPHLVQWSTPADPGSLPNSWDYSDPNVDAGRNDLPDIDAGVIQDGLPLGGRFYIYKEGSVWRMTSIGGEFIFDFKPFLETAGLLAPRCLTVTGEGKNHVFATQDDVVLHNGIDAKSLLDSRMRNAVFGAISTVSYKNSFVFTNKPKDEVWFCFPEHGETHPSRALIWNYQYNVLSEAEVNFRNASYGKDETAADLDWTTGGEWLAGDEPWSESTWKKVIACDPANSKMVELDEGTTYDGTAFTATLARRDLGATGRKRDGSWIVNFASKKFVHRIWIKASGNPFSVRMGSAPRPDGTVTWTAAQTFTPATDKYVDVLVEGEAMAIEFSGTSWFRLEGYKIVGRVVGNF